MSAREIGGCWGNPRPSAAFQTFSHTVIDPVLATDPDPVHKQTYSPPLFKELLTLVERATDGHHFKIPLAKVMIHVISGKPLKEISESSDEYSMVLQWIRNAVDGVLKDPYRSFLEIILNAIDAGVIAKETIGQFGLGFKSAFAFLSLKETNGCKIIINSQSEHSKGIRIDFEYDFLTEEIYVEFWPIDPGNIFYGGTSVKIIPNFSFSKASLEKIYNYTCHAAQTTKAKLAVKYDKAVQMMGSSSASHLIEISITPTLLLVSDKGCGFNSFECLANLLNISNSTKKAAKNSVQKKGECIFYSPISRTKNYRPQVKIFVNSIVIFEMEVPFHFKINEDFDICIHLPYCQQITSRNEIFIDPKIIRDLINKTINDSLLHPRLLCALFVALQIWENHCGNEQFKNVHTAYLKEMLNDWIVNHPRVLIINIEHASFFNSILPKDVERIFLLPSLTHFCFRKLEQFLQFYFAKECCFELEHLAITGRLIPGRNIAFVNDVLLKTPTDFNFWNLTFFPKSWLKNMDRESLAKEISYTLPHLSQIDESERGFIKYKIELLKNSSFDLPKNFEIELNHFIELLSIIKSNNALTMEQKVRIENFRESYISILGHALNFDLSREPISYVTNRRKITSIFEKSSWNLDSPILHKTLLLLSAHPILFNKILDWTLEHWSNIADLNDDSRQKKPRLISDTLLVIPGPTNTSPLGLIALLINNRIEFHIIFQMIRESRNLYELMILGNLIHLAKQRSTLRIFQFSPNSIQATTKLELSIQHYIDHILHCQCTFEEIRNWYFSNVWYSGDFKNVEPYIAQFIENVRLTDKKLDHRPTESFMSSDIVQSLASTQISFNLKQLIQAFILYPNLKQLLMKGKLQEGLSNICSHKGILTDRIQQLVQSTNARPYYQACIVALLRNSVEALQTHFYTNKDIIFKIEMLTNSRIYFSAQDFISFPTLSCLFNAFITDYSPKKGHWGSELFILYKKARQVVFTTRVLSENKVYIVSVTPIRNESKQVEDLQIRIVEASEEFHRKNPKFTGTKIEVCTLPIEEKSLLSEYLEASSNFRFVLESSNLTKDDVSLWLIDHSDSEAIRNSHIEIFRSNKSDISVTKSHLAHHGSCVTIGGVFFQSFALFNQKYKVMPPNFFRHFQNGFSLNLPNHYGKIVQNRWEILFTSEQIDELRVVLANAFYLDRLEQTKGNCFVYSNESGHIGNIEQFYILEYSSQLDVYILNCEKQKDTQSIENFMTHFIPNILLDSPYKNFRQLLMCFQNCSFNLKNSFLARINKEFEAKQIKIVARMKWVPYSQEKWKEVILDLKKLIGKWTKELDDHKNSIAWVPIPNIPVSQSTFLLNLFTKGVLPWIKNKFNPGSFPISDEETIRQKFGLVLNKTVEDLPPFSLQLEGATIADYKVLLSHCDIALKVLMDCLTAYCKIYIQKINRTASPPTVQGVYHPNSYAAASFHQDSNIVKINFRNENAVSYFDLLGSIAARDNKKILENMFKLFVPNLTNGGLLNHELEHYLQNQVCKEALHGYVENLSGDWTSFESSTIYTGNHVIYYRLLLEFVDEAEAIILKAYGKHASEVYTQLGKLLRNDKIYAYVMSRCCK